MEYVESAGDKSIAGAVAEGLPAINTYQLKLDDKALNIAMFIKAFTAEAESIKKILYKCNYQDSAKTVYTADEGSIYLTGIVYIPNDIATNLSALCGGSAVIKGIERTIYSGTKARDPDGTVNYCKLELI